MILEALEDRTVLSFISVSVTFNNFSGASLQLQSDNLDHGEWSTQPPATIPAGTTVTWQSDSDGFLTGTQGDATYQVAGSSATTNVTWDDPFIGSNSYGATASPGFADTYQGTGGDNASVSYTFTQGSASPAASWFTPAAITKGYNFPSTFPGTATAANGQGQTIAIVDEYVDPNISADFQQFNSQFGLPQMNQPGGPTFTQVNYNNNAPTAGSGNPWPTETSLDVEWAHAIAPGANILLVECAPSDVYGAANFAAGQPGVCVVSMSIRQNPGDSDPGPLSHNGVTFVSTSGDDQQFGYPEGGTSALIVGGTVLTLNADNSYNSETAWLPGPNVGSGGGLFQDGTPEPSWQVNVVPSSLDPAGVRADPDVSYAAQNFAICDSFDYGDAFPWSPIGGTSAGAPQWAALIAIINQGRAINNLPALNSGSDPTLGLLYSLPAADFHDVTTPNPPAAPGYDLVTGIGSPDAGLIIQNLWNYDPTHAPAGPPGTQPSTTIDGFDSPPLENPSGPPAGFPALGVNTPVAYAGHSYVASVANNGTIILTVDGTAYPVDGTEAPTGFAPPSLAVFNNQLYMAWSNSLSGLTLDLATIDIGLNGEPIAFNLQIGTSVGFAPDAFATPALVTLDNALFVATVGEDTIGAAEAVLNFINVTSQTAWPTPYTLAENPSNPAPYGLELEPDTPIYLTVFQNQLYFTWTEYSINGPFTQDTALLNLIASEQSGLTTLSGVSVVNGVLEVTGDQDTADEPDNITIDATSGGVEVTVNGHAVEFDASQFQSIVVSGAGGINTIQVDSLPSGCPLTIQSASSSDDAVSIGVGKLDGIQSPITITGNGHDSVTIDDSSDTAGATASINASSFDFNGVHSLITWSGLNSLNFSGGGGVNTITVNHTSSVPGGLVVWLGNGSGNLSIIGPASPLNVVGGSSVTEQLSSLVPGVAIAIDGDDGDNTLVSPAGANTWEISGKDSGSLDGLINFTGITNLGGGGTDDFQFQLAGSIAGNIDGAGNATLDYSQILAAVTVDLQTGTASAVGGTISNIAHFVGNSNSPGLLTGPNSAASWTIDGTNSGSVDGLSFQSFENLTGGAGADQFAFLPGGSITGDLDGGGGTNTLDYADLTGAVTVNLLTDTASGIGGTFSDITNFVGNANPDSTITAPGGTWIISGPDVESVAGFSFSAFPNVVAGGGPDDFVFEPGGSVSGNLGGAPGFTNTLDYSARTDRVNVDLQTDVASDIGGTFSNISNFIGGSNSYNTIFGPDATWMITAPNAESVAGNTFSSFGNLVGGTGPDQFVFQPGGSVTGNIDGGGGTNTLDYSLLATKVAVNLAADTASDIRGTFARISKFVGSSGNNALTLPSQTLCDITGSNSGAIYSQTFTAFGNLFGAPYDQFVFFPGGSVTGNLTGMGGSNQVSYANLSTAVTVKLGTNTASNIGGTFSGISRFVGGTNMATVVGPNGPTSWAITGVNTIDALGMTFSDFPNVTGGSGNDALAISGAGALTGSIDGGGGVNSLNYTGYPANVIVDLVLGRATGISGGISNIQNVTGGNGNSLLVGNAQANVLVGGAGRNILIGEGGADSLTGGGADSILIGGSTVWDGNMTALQAIFSVWNRPDLSFQERISLLSGNGPAHTALLGNYLLNASTLIADAAVDSLYGGASSALDWFFETDSDDTLAEHNSADQVTEL